MPANDSPPGRPPELLRLPLFITLLGVLAAVLALTVPVPNDFEQSAAALHQSAPLAPRCLALRSAAGGIGMELPGIVRLDTARGAPYGTYPHGWRAAEGGPDRFAGFTAAAWAYATADSIDIAWHHSPILRLPAVGDRRVGRAGWRGHSNLFLKLMEPDVRVEAEEVPCREHFPS